jgi:hypothetical protein
MTDTNLVSPPRRPEFLFHEVLRMNFVSKLCSDRSPCQTYRQLVTCLARGARSKTSNQYSYAKSTSHQCLRALASTRLYSVYFEHSGTWPQRSITPSSLSYHCVPMRFNDLSTIPCALPTHRSRSKVTDPVTQKQAYRVRCSHLSSPVGAKERTTSHGLA